MRPLQHITFIPGYGSGLWAFQKLITHSQSKEKNQEQNTRVWQKMNDDTKRLWDNELSPSSRVNNSQENVYEVLRNEVIIITTQHLYSRFTSGRGICLPWEKQVGQVLYCTVKIILAFDTVHCREHCKLSDCYASTLRIVPASPVTAVRTLCFLFLLCYNLLHSPVSTVPQGSLWSAVNWSFLILKSGGKGSCIFSHSHEKTNYDRITHR